jgi:hypothetical protein
VLERASERLKLDRMSEAQQQRLKLLHGSLMYRDARLSGYGAAAVVEVIEHLDPPRLAAFERVVFEFAKPATVVLTTPNAEYNLRFESLRHGNRSTILTSQVPTAKWHDHIGDPTVADALCDRVLHRGHRLVLKGPSRRKEDSETDK